MKLIINLNKLKNLYIDYDRNYLFIFNFKKLLIKYTQIKLSKIILSVYVVEI